MAFSVDGREITYFAETQDSTRYSGKNPFFNNSKISINGIDYVATAPSGYHWTTPLSFASKLKVSGTASTVSQKGCRPQWVLRHTISKGTYYISTSSNYNCCYYQVSTGGNILTGKIMDIESHTTTIGPDCYVFVTLQAAGGAGHKSYGAIGGYSGGGGGGGAFIAACVKTTTLVASGDAHVSNTYWRCLMARKGSDASTSSGGAGGVAEILNSTSSNTFKELLQVNGAAGGNSGANGSGTAFQMISHCPESTVGYSAQSGGTYGSGNGGGGGASVSGAGGNGGGGDGKTGGVGAGGGGASWYLFKDQYGADGGAEQIKIFY